MSEQLAENLIHQVIQLKNENLFLRNKVIVYEKLLEWILFVNHWILSYFSVNTSFSKLSMTVSRLASIPVNILEYFETTWTSQFEEATKKFTLFFVEEMKSNFSLNLLSSNNISINLSGLKDSLRHLINDLKVWESSLEDYARKIQMDIFELNRGSDEEEKWKNLEFYVQEELKIEQFSINAFSHNIKTFQINLRLADALMSKLAISKTCLLKNVNMKTDASIDDFIETLTAFWKNFINFSCGDESLIIMDDNIIKETAARFNFSLFKDEQLNHQLMNPPMFQDKIFMNILTSSNSKLFLKEIYSTHHMLRHWNNFFNKDDDNNNNVLKNFLKKIDEEIATRQSNNAFLIDSETFWKYSFNTSCINVNNLNFDKIINTVCRENFVLRLVIKILLCLPFKKIEHAGSLYSFLQNLLNSINSCYRKIFLKNNHHQNQIKVE